MQRLKQAAFALALVLGGIAVGPTAWAADAKPASIAFVDVPRVMRESAAAKSVRAQLTRQETTFEGEIKAQSDRLKTQEQALASQRSSLSADQFEQKRSDFQTQVDALNRQVDRRRQQMAFAQDDAMKKLQPVLSGVVADVAKTVGASIVLDTSRVIVSSNNLDITDQVIAQLDRKMPSIAVNFNAPAPPPSAAGASSVGSVASGARPPPPPGQ